MQHDGLCRTAAAHTQAQGSAMAEDLDKLDLTGITAGVVAAYVEKNPVSRTDLPELIASIHAAFSSLSGLGVSAEPVPAPLVPAVSIKKSVTDDYIICLEDGKKFKSLKRHLMTDFNMSPEEYRAKWKLPADYPMVAPSYAAARSELAKSMGLGRKKAEPIAAPVPVKRKARAKKPA